MYGSKKGEIGIVLVVVLVISAIGFFALRGGNFTITGAATYSGTTCNWLVNESSSLVGDVTCSDPTGTAFRINASNIEFDCQGYTMSGDSIGGEFGFRFMNSTMTNITIKNCRITTFATGVELQGNNIILQNTTFRGNSIGIEVSSSTGPFLITNVNVTNSTSDGIWINAAPNITLQHSYVGNNSQLNINFDGTSGTLDNTTFFNNTIAGKIDFTANVNQIFIHNNNFNATALNSSGAGAEDWNISRTTTTNIMNGITRGGNFYSDYAGVDTDDDGIGETAYTIPGTASDQDKIPLVRVYQFIAPQSQLSFNSTYNATNSLSNGSYHSTKQNITFFNTSNGLKVLQIEAYFNQTANLSALNIETNNSALAVNLSRATGINASHIFFLNNTNLGNGLIICPNASTLGEVGNFCLNAISITGKNISDKVYINGILVTLENTQYRIENVTGTGVVFAKNASLVIWDETDNQPYASQTRFIGNDTYFFTNFTNTNNTIITDATCNITFEDGTSKIMAYNATRLLYQTNRTYNDPGNYQWNVTCSRDYYDTLAATDTLTMNGCGNLARNYTLTANLTSDKTCFVVNTSNVVLDGAGYTITNINLTNISYAVLSNDQRNLTIKNFFRIQNYQNGIFLNYTLSSTIFNNTINLSYINTTIDTLYAIQGVGTQNNNISQNKINFKNITQTLGGGVTAFVYPLALQSANSTAIFANEIQVEIHTALGNIFSINILRLGSSNRDHDIRNNNFSASVNQTYGIHLVLNVFNNTIAGNFINSTSSAIYFSDNGVDNNTLSSNSIISTASHGIEIAGDDEGNILLNNNITSGNLAIADGDNYISVNYLIYNNTWGDIRWIDNGTGSFLRNMDINGSLGLGTNLFLSNNTASLNTSALVPGLINTSANITLIGLEFSSIRSIYKWANFSTNSTAIIDNGSSCLGISCSQITFAGGILVFNTTSFSSFAASQDNSPPTITTPIILPTPAYTNSTLEVNVTYTDANSDNGTIRFYWYTDGLLVYTQTNNSITTGSIVYASLNGINFTKNQIVSLNVSANDTDVALNRSANITILNSAPLFNHSLLAQTASSGQLFTYKINTSDMDGDTVNHSDNTSLFEINISTGLINFTPTENNSGLYSITLNLTDGTTNTSANFTFTINDVISPNTTSPTNTSLNFRRRQNFTANITLHDGFQLSTYIFSTNASGAWANVTRNINGTQYNASEQANITLSQGNQVCWYYWVNDTSNNINQSTTYCFTVQNTAPAQVSNYNNLTLTLGGSVIFNVSHNFSEIDDETLNYSARDTPIASLILNQTTKLINITATAIGEGNSTINATDGTTATESNLFWIISSAAATSSGGGGISSPTSPPVVEPLKQEHQEQVPTITPSPQQVPAATSPNMHALRSGTKINFVQDLPLENGSVTVSRLSLELENPFDQELTVNLSVEQDIAPKTFITTKTVVNNLAGIEITRDLSHASCLLAELTTRSVTIPPQEKLTTTIDVKHPSCAGKQDISIVISALEQEIAEQNISVGMPLALANTAVEVHPPYLEIVAAIVGDTVIENNQDSLGLTGNAILEKIQKRDTDTYYVEISINKLISQKEEKKPPFRWSGAAYYFSKASERTVYTELFGPFNVKNEDRFVFAQQFRYDQNRYNGPHKIVARIFRDDEVLTVTETQIEFT